MAEEGGSDVKAPEGAGKAGKGITARLGKKVGPLPLGVWLLIAAGIFYFVYKKNNAGGTGGPQTDPAGNVGTINPATGYVYGSSEDQAALGSGSGSIGSDTDTGTGGSTVGGQYADNNAWAVAAINYLVSIGVDATSANTAVTQFLSSQTLTTQQQGEINLVIQRLGAPPSPPEPGGNTPPIVTPPSSSTYATNPPTGFTATAVNVTSIVTKWNKTTNAKSYTLEWGTDAAKMTGSMTVSTPAGTITGLKPNTTYHLRVHANPAKGTTGIYAGLAKTTDKSKATSPSNPKPKPNAAPAAHKVTKDGESFSSIAQQYHYSKGGHALWVYNYTDAPHSAAAKATIKARGADLVVHGETVYIPRS